MSELPKIPQKVTDALPAGPMAAPVQPQRWAVSPEELTALGMPAGLELRPLDIRDFMMNAGR
jgi:hypothetical protein